MLALLKSENTHGQTNCHHSIQITAISLMPTMRTRNTILSVDSSDKDSNSTTKSAELVSKMMEDTATPSLTATATTTKTNDREDNSSKEQEEPSNNKESSAPQVAIVRESSNVVIEALIANAARLTSARQPLMTLMSAAMEILLECLVSPEVKCKSRMSSNG